MSYEIRKYNGNVLVTLADGLTDDTYTSLTFIGKNVSNFGKFQNENFLHLLENFSSGVEPANKITGQLWFDTDDKLLKLNDGGQWVPQAALDFLSTAPVSSHQSYLWFDSTNKQLYINTATVGVDYFLIGPERVEGFGVTRFVSRSIKDIGNADHAIISMVVDGETLGVISTASFTISPGDTIQGFSTSTIVRGINLKNSTTNDVPFIGRSYYSNLSTTATNLAGGASYSLPYQTTNGLTSFVNIGSNNTVLYSNGSSFTWKSLDNVTAALATTATNLSGGSNPGAIPYQNNTGKTSYLELENDGFVLAGGATKPKWVPISGVSAGSALYASNANTLLSSISTNTYITASTSSAATTIVERDTNSNIWGRTFIGTATTAYYADLAEKYLPDAEYEPGTVVMIGGEKEVTACMEGHRAIGVISTNPAYMMNSELVGGVYVALKGRVPVKVIGQIHKGQKLGSSDNGCATGIPPHSYDVFAIALESTIDDEGIKVIEALVL